MRDFDSPSLRICNGKLEILDQTLLPGKETWLHIDSPEKMHEAILKLRVRGAPLLGVAAVVCLELLQESGASKARLDEAALSLKHARPTAVNLSMAIDRFMLDGSTAGDLIDEDVQLCKQIACAGAPLIKESSRVLTHCNTGALATVGVGTALGVIQQAFVEEKKKFSVWVDETRPLLQGARLTCWELSKMGVPFSLICDSMAASLMAKEQVDLVIVGADRVCSNGDFANKIGTYSLAVLAAHHKIPFYVAAPSTSFDFSCASGDKIEIEQREPNEVRGFAESQWAPADCPVYNPAFDVCPASLVKSFITEKGVLAPGDFDLLKSNLN